MELEIDGKLELKITDICPTSVTFDAVFIWKGHRFNLTSDGIKQLPVGGILTLHNLTTSVKIDDNIFKEKLLEALEQK